MLNKLNFDANAITPLHFIQVVCLRKNGGVVFCVRTPCCLIVSHGVLEGELSKGNGSNAGGASSRRCSTTSILRSRLSIFDV